MQEAWWKEAVVYQIYPRSFMDSNGDGVGDLKGITARLDYLQALGVTVVWLSPIYRSPNDDNGYDVSDYREIMDEFGTMADFDALLKGLHQRGIRLVMDLVVNHSSDEHRWFTQARVGKQSPTRDYYIWRAGKADGTPPNNWGSVFSGSAWQHDEQSGEYYLHMFSKKQPDLNWENPKLRAEVYDLMEFWLQKGVDGFRMDVINMISKRDELPDLPPGSDGNGYITNGPRVHVYLQEMNRQVLSRYDVMTVGETPGVTPELARLYTEEGRHELCMVFQFEHMDVDVQDGEKWSIKPWHLTELKAILSKWQRELGDRGWNSLYLNNHDQPRMVSRFGNDKEYRVQSAKLLATMLHTMQGTPYIYQGEELGMTNVAFESLEDYEDVEVRNMLRERRALPGFDEKEMLRILHYRARDNARTPMQWDSTTNAGFTAGTPWLKVNPNYTQINAEKALRNDASVLHYYRRLIALRKQHKVLVYGSFTEYLPQSEQLYAYTRSYQGEIVLVLLNFTPTQQPAELPPPLAGQHVQYLFGNYQEEGEQATALTPLMLQPYEARVYRFV